MSVNGCPKCGANLTLTTTGAWCQACGYSTNRIIEIQNIVVWMCSH